MRIARGISIANTSKPISTAIAYDADATAFFTAASITDTTQKSAVNTLVLSLKSANIWTKMKAIYPVVGGSATTHKWNLKDPRDLDAAFRLAFATGWTHSSNGMTPSNAYADTFLNSNTILTLNSVSISFYSRTNTNAACDIGCGANLQLYCRDSGNIYARANTTNTTFLANSDGTGFYQVIRNDSANQKIVKNNTITSTVSASTAKTSQNTTIGGIYVAGSWYYATKQCAFASIGDGLTDTEASDLYTAVQTYQTTLGRQV